MPDLAAAPVPAKPRWRGVLHSWACLTSLATGSVLVALAPDPRARVAATIYALSVTLLFGTSALYHRVNWSPAARRLMKRLDHSMIFVLIAGTYTPFALVVLHGTTTVVILSVVWGGAAAGVVARLLWLQAPRWAIVPLYLGLGWVAVFILRPLLHGAGVAPLVLLVAGGLLYTLGAVAYATRRPDPRPAVFGYHEVFHLCTILAAICHYIAIFFALYAGAAAVA
ncbi:MAG: PAQR family membrane homeostasis protein TrhA [Mycobacteriales bacterium]